MLRFHVGAGRGTRNPKPTVHKTAALPLELYRPTFIREGQSADRHQSRRTSTGPTHSLQDPSTAE